MRKAYCRVCGRTPESFTINAPDWKSVQANPCGHIVDSETIDHLLEWPNLTGIDDNGSMEPGTVRDILRRVFEQ